MERKVRGGKGCPTMGKLNQDGREKKETHGRSEIPYMSRGRLEPIEDWFRVLPYDYTTVPRVVLARKEHFINRRV